MKKFLSMLLVLIIIIGIWWIYGKVSVVETRMTAVSAEYEDSFEAKGVIIRNEYPITSEMEGTLQSNVVPGTRVTRYTNVGYVYSGNADEQVVKELAEVNERIEELEKIQDSTLLNLTDIDDINARITSYCERIAKKAREGNNSEIQAYTNDINMLIGRKRYLEGENQGENNDLTQLTNRKNALESRLSGKRVGLNAPVSGLYYDFVDGYESIKTADVTTFTAEKVNKIIKGESVGSETENAVCKIADNSGWIISVVTDKDTIQGLAEGQRVSLRFTGTDENPVEAKIHSFVYDGKKVILNIEGTCYAGDVYNRRVCTVDLIKNTYRGLKIPSEAIMDGGEAGKVVEVRKSSGIKKKKVTVLYSLPDGNAIVSAGTDPEELLLYDEVIVKSRRE